MLLHSVDVYLTLKPPYLH